VLKANVPEIARITPPRVAWKRGRDANPRKVKVEFLGDKPVKILGVDGTKGFSVGVKEVLAGKVYELTVTPNGTGKRVSTALLVRTDLARVIKVNAAVR